MITLPIVPMIVAAAGALLLAVCAGFIGGAVMCAGKKADNEMDEDAPIDCRSCTYDMELAKGRVDPHCCRCMADGKLTEYRRRKK